MKKLFDSVAFQSTAAESESYEDTQDIKYAVDDGYENNPYLHLAITTPLKDGGTRDVNVDISREDIVEILNDIVDEWPEIIDSHKVSVKEGIEVIPVFS